ncbi:focal adhesion protein tensin [Haematobia irritans]|uniref:focal adhesion protein tensin n=1 Tax=Haematobia irritans TaxID=7368 RepID=UPI003F5075C3
MRSHYDELYASSSGETTTNKFLNTSTSHNNNSNNNNTNYTSYNNSSNGTIPYHARENSLPFSYGQIKTSTPSLRPTTKSTASSSLYNKNGVEHDLDFDFDFGLSSGRNGGGFAKTSNNNNNNGLIINSNNGSGKDVNYNLKQNTTTNTSTSIDRANKRSEFFSNGSVGLGENSHNSPTYRAGGGGGGSADTGDFGCTQTLRYNKIATSSSGVETPDASMIKVQPRLTSPLLVRKTLSGGGSSNSSRSPTRSNTNTIANTYHYSYGSGGDGDNFDKFGVNGNINYKNDAKGSYGHNSTLYSGSGGGSSDILTTKTPARHDFDELLRERREKVYNEYRSTTQEVIAPSPNSSPLPPPRRFMNGTVQLPSTLPPSLRHHNGNSNGSATSASHPPQIPQRSQSQNGKYNFDFQFNLNLDDQIQNNDNDFLKRRQPSLDRSPQRSATSRSYQQLHVIDHHRDADGDDDILRRRNQTLDRYNMTTTSQRQTTSYQQRHLQQDDHDDVDFVRRPNQQLYQTRDIPLDSYNVERNYHTSSLTTHAKNQYNNSDNTNRINGRETLSPSSMLDIYATPYDDERNNQRPRPAQPLEANMSNNNHNTTAATTTTTVRTIQHSNHSGTPYGHAPVYGDGNVGQQPPMPDRDASPIYATSTKKVTTTNSMASTSAYRNASQQQPGILTSPKAATSMSTLTIMDYPSPSPTLRPETPAFPVTPRTPFAAGSNTPTLARSSNLHLNSNTTELQNYSTETIYGTNYRPRLASSLSMANSEPQEVAAHLVKFAKDSSKFWYKPNLSREEAISLLVNAPPGTFVVRDSTTYKNAYGLVLRVSQPPPGSTATGKPDELVRHFLIEPTTRGVRLKGCANEPVFTSLSALVYEHSINQLALPCLLQIPDRDIVTPLVEPTPAQTQLLTQGAACNVLWLFSCDTESLTGEEAIRKAIRQMYAPNTNVSPTEVHFKVSHQGITLTDNTRKKFFRKHYTADIISFCAIDPDHRLWTMQEHGNDKTTIVGALKKTIFAFVARRSASSKDNQCHVFCDLAINQPASAIVSFVNKTLPTEKQRNYIL